MNDMNSIVIAFVDKIILIITKMWLVTSLWLILTNRFFIHNNIFDESLLGIVEQNIYMTQNIYTNVVVFVVWLTIFWK